MAERRFTQANHANVRVEERTDGSAVIIGYASVFYDPDNPGTQYDIFGDGQYVERIMPGAKFEYDATDPAALFNHNPDNLLGRHSAGTLRLSTDKIGLRYEIDAADTAIARDVLANIRAKNLRGSSFAFSVTSQAFRTEDKVDIREISGVALYDVGPVTYPAYEATTTGIRSLGIADDAIEARNKWRASVEAAERLTRMKVATAPAVEKLLTGKDS